MPIVEAYYHALTTLFSPLMGFHPAIAELMIAIFITFTITVFYKLLIDQNAIKEIRGKMKELQSKSKELQKTDPSKAKEMTTEMFALTNKQMKMTTKPLIVTMLFVILIFPWLKTVFIGPVVNLPFSMFGREWFGWFLWYFVTTMPLSSIFRKAMGVM